MCSNSSQVSPWRVLVAGGCYAGLAAALNLLDRCEGRSPRFSLGDTTDPTPKQKVPVQIAIVDERDGYYHLIGSPLALAEEQYASKAWVKFEDLAALKHPSIRVLQGSVSSVDCGTMTAKISLQGSNVQYNERYDFLIASSGLRRVWPTVPQSLVESDYMSEALGHIEAVMKAKEGVVVIGGGAVGIEMAAELKAVKPSQMVTLIHSRDRLLSSEPLPEDFKDKTLSLLRDGGVNVIVGQRVTNIKSHGQTSTLTLSNGAKLTTAHVISAISKPTPSTAYLPPSSPNYLHHFAVGDIAAWSGIKRCGAAMHMGHYAAENLYQQILYYRNRSSTSSSPASTSPSSASASEGNVSDSARSTNSEQDTKPLFKMLSDHPPMIGLALGKIAISYSLTEGMKYGEDVMQRMFGDDLGWSICWNYMQLGREADSELGKERRQSISREVEGARNVVDVEGHDKEDVELVKELEMELEKIRVREKALRASEVEERM